VFLPGLYFHDFPGRQGDFEPDCPGGKKRKFLFCAEGGGPFSHDIDGGGQGKPLSSRDFGPNFRGGGEGLPAWPCGPAEAAKWWGGGGKKTF